MKQGQTSVRGGVQDLLCPTETVFIKQGANEGSHTGIEAVDLDNYGKRTPYYAPCDLKVVNIHHGGATVTWQTEKPVRLANGKISHITIVTAHDETINYGVGFRIKQGQQMGNMGTGGISSTGFVHVHLEQGYGHQKEVVKNGYQFKLWQNGKWVYYDIYGLKQQIPFEQAYFMDGTEIISGTAKWIYLKDVKVQEDKGGVFTFKDKLDSPVHIRVGEEGQRGKETGYYYKGGETLYYDRLYVDGGYTWVTYIGETSGERTSVAIAKGDDLWGSYTAKPQNNPQPPKVDKIVISGVVKDWTVHKNGQLPSNHNIVGRLKPSQFGGLTYDIKGRPYKDVVTIQTHDYGLVNLPLGGVPKDWYKVS